MVNSDVYLYSPLSLQTASKGENPALLIQFILSEILDAIEACRANYPLSAIFSFPNAFFPYDWSYEIGSLNKIVEHTTLLPVAFPKLKQEALAFTQSMQNALSKADDKHSTEICEELYAFLITMYDQLIPFIVACKNCGSVVLFLIKRGDTIKTFSHLNPLLKKMFPKGIHPVIDQINEIYTSRNLSPPTDSFNQLILDYES